MAGEQYKKKRKKGSRWGPFGLPFGTPRARLDSLGVPFGPPFTFKFGLCCHPCAPLRHRPRKDTNIIPKCPQNEPKMEPKCNKNHFDNEPHFLRKTSQKSMACRFSAWGPAVTPALRAQYGGPPAGPGRVKLGKLIAKCYGLSLLSKLILLAEGG